MSSLTAHEVEQLVALRLSLEDALSRAKGATKYRRGPAIVALDATVERASAIVAVTRGMTLPRNGQLDDLISRLVQELGSKWKPAVLPDIRHLRRARNASQHEGLEPDRDLVPLWASAASNYVSGLIDAQFAIDIRRVVLSDAIRDADLRHSIREAEVARDGGDLGLCVNKATEAFWEASNRWNRLRGWGRGGFPPGHREVFDKKSFDFLKGELGKLQAILQVAAFSQDLVEAEWFTVAIAEESGVLTRDDVDRVLTLAFEWIVEYERAAATWTPNRRHRAAVARRKVRSEDGPASIDECVSVDLEYGDIRAVFRIADVPDEDGYQIWARTVGELLPTPDSQRRWAVLDDGTVTLHREAEPRTDLGVDVVTLSSALLRAETSIQEKLDAANKKELLTQQRREEFAASIQAVLGDIPAWVEDIKLSDEEIGNGAAGQLVVTLSQEVQQLRFGESTSSSFFDDRNSVREVILEHELVDECYWTAMPSDLGIAPVLDSKQLMKVFDHADAAVRKQVEVDRRKTGEQEAVLTAAKASIAAKLSELT